ncbi:MAG TPA: hypothetical protein DCZ92_14430 [Elusimicrobia bacterium]|nr:MAG: hypothetical protein A2016_09025 [Elusimicrobia bacterium GWF2_62_30]HBA61980.1 hypothetical protein [Elusimicrobiota bacterium]
MKLEKAVRLEAAAAATAASPEKLRAVLARFDRVYLGAEFCANLLPSPETARAQAAFFLSRGKKVTFLTPMSGPAGLPKLKAVLKALSRLSRPGRQKGTLELTVNDFGALELAAQLKLPLKLNLGRLLYDNLFMFSAGRLLLTSRAALDFFLKAGVSRFELSSPGRRFRADLGRAGGKFAISLYYPYLNLTSTRACLPGLAAPAAGKEPDPDSCGRECGACALELSHPRVRERLIVKGNTTFLYFPEKFYAKESELAKLGVDRLVYCPRP